MNATRTTLSTQQQEIHSSVGSRVVNVNGLRGTVKYIGPVDGSTGIWLGVEWDDPTKGKHSGKGYFGTLQVIILVLV